MFRRFLIPLALLLALATTATCAADQPRYLELTLLTTNDLHANLVPFNHPDSLKGRGAAAQGRRRSGASGDDH